MSASYTYDESKLTGYDYTVEFMYNPSYSLPCTATIKLMLPVLENDCIPILLQSGDIEMFDEYLSSFWGTKDVKEMYRYSGTLLTAKTWDDLDKLISDLLGEIYITFSKIVETNLEMLMSQPINYSNSCKVGAMVNSEDDLFDDEEDYFSGYGDEMVHLGMIN